MHIVKENGNLSLLAALFGIALLAVIVVSCGGQGAEPESTEVPKPAPTATARGENTEAPQPENTPTPYSQGIPSPVVVTATVIPPATAVAAPTAAAGVAAQPAPATSTPAAAADAGVAATVQPTSTSFPVVAPTAAPVVAPTATAEVVAQPALATSTPAPTTTATPTPEPLELWEVDWGSLAEAKSVHVVQAGERLFTDAVINIPRTRGMLCGPDIGSELDESNPTWFPGDNSAHLWILPPDGSDGYCVGGIWPTEWTVYPIPLLTPRQEANQRAENSRKPLVFSSLEEWRPFSTPPIYPYEAGAVMATDDIFFYKDDGSKEPWMVSIGGNESIMACYINFLPLAVWTEKEGFLALSDEDENDFPRSELDYVYNDWLEEEASEEEATAIKEDAREMGVYFVYPFHENSLQRGFCWRVANPEDISDRSPCIDCLDWRELEKYIEARN